MERWLFLLALLFASFCASAARHDSTHPAAQRVREFLDAHGHQHALPDDSQMDSLRGFLSRRLLTSLEAARSEQRRYIRKFPGEKAPWSEGNLFHSIVFEDFEDFIVGEPAQVAGAMIVPVTFRIEKRYWPNGGESPWMDQYVMTWENDEWRLSDVVFLERAAFGAKGGSRLREHLDHRPSEPPGH